MMTRIEFRNLLEQLMNAEASFRAALLPGIHKRANFNAGLEELTHARRTAREHLDAWPGGDGNDEAHVVVSSKGST